VENLYDILHIIEKYPIQPEYEYNIDLQALHSIKPELTLLKNMIGLESLKQSVVDQLLYFIQNLHQGPTTDFKHTILLGPPGTGKTEVARILGEMYSKIGILRTATPSPIHSLPIFKKVTRTDLVAGYLGQTALKTQKVIESCLGGVLFIDEAYSLGDPTDMFAKECVDTLCEAMSCHKDNLMVIIAGYEEAIKTGFLQMNPGLESRFIWRFSMEAYNPQEMKSIFMTKTEKSGWKSPENLPTQWFEKRKQFFSNYGRDMESLFTYTKIQHGRRIFGSPEKKILTLEDLEKGYEVFLKNKGNKKQHFLHDMYS
jgi:SpoVK/Ycf46/Vps4 family AAA+-type ATPase